MGRGHSYNRYGDTDEKPAYKYRPHVITTAIAMCAMCNSRASSGKRGVDATNDLMQNIPRICLLGRASDGAASKFGLHLEPTPQPYLSSSQAYAFRRSKLLVISELILLPHHYDLLQLLIPNTLVRKSETQPRLVAGMR